VEFPITTLIEEKVSEIIKLVDVFSMNLINLTIINKLQSKYINGDLRELADLYPRRFFKLIKIKFDTI
jgi:hypothetical protein